MTGRSLRPQTRTYEGAGVSLATAESIVERLRTAAESTGAEGFGAFAGLYPLDERRLLAASMDSVGSKLMLARRADRLRWAGMDLAAHCINDVLCSGADPLFLLDYVAANRIDEEDVAQLVEGAAEVCREAGCVLIGGETAELPGIYQVRSLVGDGDFDADLLLAPHRLYLRDVRDLRAHTDVRALAHVTGGGILGNLSRVLPEGVEARIAWDSWERPTVFAWLAERGVDEEELRRVFNLGIGMCAVVPEAPPGALTIGELV